MGYIPYIYIYIMIYIYDMYRIYILFTMGSIEDKLFIFMTWNIFEATKDLVHSTWKLGRGALSLVISWGIL